MKLIAAALATTFATTLVIPIGTASAATVFTLEGGFAALLPWGTPTSDQLRGDLCNAASGNTCTLVEYSTIPVGTETEKAADTVKDAIADTPVGEEVLLFGHSQGGQVIYAALRDWRDDPTTAPSPDKVSWVSIGNPENKYGSQFGGIGYDNGMGVPADTPYVGTEVIRQYDGWADWPQDTSNLIAVANAVVGMQTLHSDYKDVDLADPKNRTHVEGKITYVWVPTDTLPLVAWTGPFAPALDNMMRPIVEAGYDRPVTIPDPTPPAAEASPEALQAPLRTNNIQAADTDEKAQKPARRTLKSVGTDLRRALKSLTSKKSVRDRAGDGLNSDDAAVKPVKKSKLAAKDKPVTDETPAEKPADDKPATP